MTEAKKSFITLKRKDQVKYLDILIRLKANLEASDIFNFTFAKISKLLEFSQDWDTVPTGTLVKHMIYRSLIQPIHNLWYCCMGWGQAAQTNSDKLLILQKHALCLRHWHIKQTWYYLDLKTMRQLYYTLIFPYLNYGILSWGNNYKTKLNNVHARKISTCIFSAHSREHSIVLYISVRKLYILYV